MKSGVYVIQFSENTIKIGRSQDIEKRLKSYKGYNQKGLDAQRLLIAFYQDHKKFEKWAHLYAEHYGLNRVDRLEIFEVNDIPSFLDAFEKEIHLFDDSIIVQRNFQQDQKQVKRKTNIIKKINNTNTIKQIDSTPVKQKERPVFLYLDQFVFGNKEQIRPMSEFYLIHDFSQLQI